VCPAAMRPANGEGCWGVAGEEGPSVGGLTPPLVPRVINAPWEAECQATAPQARHPMDAFAIPAFLNR